jgi:hypothetical protein
MHSFRDLDAMSYRYCEGCGATSVLVQDAHNGTFMLVQVPEFGVEKWDEVELAPAHEQADGEEGDQVSDEEAEAIARLAAEAHPEDQLQPEEDREQEHLNEIGKPDGGAESGLEQTLPSLPADPAEQPVPPRPKRARRKTSHLPGVQAPKKRREDAEAAS